MIKSQPVTIKVEIGRDAELAQDVYTKRRSENWIEYHQRIMEHNLNGGDARPINIDILQAQRDKEKLERQIGD